MNVQIIIFLLFVACFTHRVEAAEWVGIFRDKKHPGKCAIEPSLIIDEGVSIKDPSGECRRITCGFNGTAIFQSCGIIGLPSHCRFGNYIDIDQPYPHCCERKIICNTEIFTNDI
ncbi:PREDICTED: uncharacterized protein LOC108620298 [Drosophila arizonae]|uniref:Uncharacterized protein LOC108620298 n=1 Tax=Drosophila arizonae TaxID=7263 RepID=A0ABM1PZQ6_DROAR|nr:PREDICTED: uncharacterized protein LOC108620298 [Drosophila arizonae]